MKRSLFVAVSLVVFVIGLFVIFNSVRWGSQAANAHLQSQGGMDTTQFMIIFQEYINGYKWIGAILAVVSGLGSIKLLELK